MQTSQQNPRSKATEGPLGRSLLEEKFYKLPHVIADTLVSGADTFNSAHAQLVANASTDFILVGTNAVSSCATRDTTGGVALTTTTASADQVIIAPNTTSGVTAWTGTNWKVDNGPTFEATIVTGASVVATTIIAGFKLTNTPVIATDDDQAYFRYCDTENSGNWQLVISLEGVDLVLPTNIAVTASTQFNLRVEVDAALVAHFFINGEEHYPNVTSNLVDAGVSFIPYVGVQTNTTAAKAITCRGIRCSVN